MAGENLEVVRLRSDFYREGFYKLFFTLMLTIASIGVILFTSIYLLIHKPRPIAFDTDNDLRAFAPVPVSEPYVKQADLIQWVSEVLPASFTFDFLDYPVQLKKLQSYYTQNGWTALTTQLNTYANATQIQTNKWFVNASASGTPTIPNQGLINGRYGWWIQLPLKITYSSVDNHSETWIVLQALVVRVSTADNLTGLAIENVIVQVQKGGPKATIQQGRRNG